MDTKPDLSVSSRPNNLPNPVITPDLSFISVLKDEIVGLNEHVFNPPD